MAGAEDLALQFRLAGAAAITLNLVMMALSFLIARTSGLSRPQQISVCLEAGIQNGTLALGISLGLLQSPAIAMPSVVYSLFMFLSGGLLVLWSGRASGKTSRADTA